MFRTFLLRYVGNISIGNKKERSKLIWKDGNYEQKRTKLRVCVQAAGTRCICIHEMIIEYAPALFVLADLNLIKHIDLEQQKEHNQLSPDCLTPYQQPFQQFPKPEIWPR